MSNTFIIKTAALPGEIGRKCIEKGMNNKAMIQRVNSKEKMLKQMYLAMPLLVNISNTLGFNFFELYTEAPELRAKIQQLEAELAALKQKTEKIIIEHAVYKDTMEILKRHVTVSPKAEEHAVNL
jgi:hypothetical protein